MTLFWLLVALAAAALWALRWRQRRRPLEKMAACIPGPPSWPLIGDALLLSPEDLYNTLFNLFKRYGSVFRVWLGPMLHVCLQDPNDLEVLLANSKCIEKGKVYDFLRLGQGLLTASGNTWRTHRKFLTSTFHVKILEHFLDIIDRKTYVLIDQLKKESNGQSFDIYPYLILYALDVLQDTAMGLNVNAQTDSESTYSKAAKDFIDTTWKRMRSPWLYPDVTFNISPTGVKHRKALMIMSDTTRNIIQKKKKEMTMTGNEKSVGGNGTRSSKRHMAFLDLLLQERATAGATFTDQDIEDEVTTFLIAGHETTAVALSFILWLLSTHQDIQDKVYNEVKLLLSNTSETTMKILNEMKYLEAVIKEGLRLYPPAPLAARQLNEDFVTKDGITLPAGTTVVVPIVLVHQHPGFYAEPEAFVPERFLDDERDSRHNFAFIPFSAGPRSCIGQRFAMLSLKASISKILLHYELLPDVEFKPKLTAHIVMKSSNGVKLKISTRAVHD